MLAGLGGRIVQGVERTDRRLLDAAGLVGHLVPEGSMFWFLATHRGQVFPDQEFADLFPSGRGRPSLPAPVAAAILTLQTLHDLSDAETAEAARCDLRWKVATGMALDDKGFHPSTLTYWRQRLARSQRSHRINEAVKRVVEETGIVAGRRRRVVDSTILADAVATQDTITQLIAAIRRVARQVPGAAAKIQAVCSGHDYSTPGQAPDRLGRSTGQGCAGVSLGQRRQCAACGAGRRQLGRAGRGCGGAVGAGRWPGRGAGRGLGRDRWALADRPQGRR
jgi:hypothetical protein